MAKTPFKHQPGRGSVFTNDKKTSEKHPDMTGSMVLMDGTEVWVSLWFQEKNDKQMGSIQIRAKDSNTRAQEPISEKAKAREPQWAAKARQEPLDDGIPW